MYSKTYMEEFGLLNKQSDTVCDCGLAAQMEALQGGWLQGRYHSGDGETVGELLSFNSVFEVNPFKVDADHAAERRTYAARKRLVNEALELKGFSRRAFLSLSTGEMRRVLFARAILSGAGRITSDDLFGGLDAHGEASCVHLLRRCGGKAWRSCPGIVLFPVGGKQMQSGRLKGAVGLPPRSRAAGRWFPCAA